MRRRAIGLWSAGAAVMLLAATLLAAGDAVVEAKRRAAQQLLREGKTQEGIQILNEIVAGESPDYRDLMLLARSQDKLGNQAEAAEAYRRVQSMVSETSRDADQRAARAEADRRIKQLDALAAKVDAAIEKFLREIDTLEREAETARNSIALDRLWSIRGAVYRADPSLGKCAFLVKSTPPNWQDTGFKVEAGQTYRARARGTWRMGPDAAHECTANGLVNQPPNQFGPIGMLQGAIDGKAPPIKLGEDVEFVSPASGILGLGRNEDLAGGADNSGSLRVLIERK